nr:p53 induced quinone oxidoreductase NecA [Nectria sp. HLS206]
MQTETMRAVDIRHGVGPASAMFISENIPKPIPKPGECLVRVHAFGINRGDTLQREGKYPGISHLTKTLGLEFSGTIAWIAESEPPQTEESCQWEIGDEVFGLLYGGGYAEYVAVNTRMLIAKPESLTMEQCGGICETWFTALQALCLIGRATEQYTRSILWHAGTSAVSIAGIQLSQVRELFGTSKAGCPKVFATSRRQDKSDFCVNELGCTGAVNLANHPNNHSWIQEIKALNGGENVDLIIDFLGGPFMESNIDLLALDGSMVQLGLLQGPVVPANANLAGLIMKRLKLEGSTLRTRSLEYQIQLRELFEKLVLPGLVDGRLRHVVDRVYPWQQVGDAHELIERNETRGKVVCVIN